MKNILLTVSYDGTNFCGWQRQDNTRTVQGEIEKVLEKIHTSVVFQVLSIYFKKMLQKTTYPAWINSFFTKLKS